MVPESLNRISTDILDTGEKVNNSIQSFGNNVISFIESIGRGIVDTGAAAISGIESFVENLFDPLTSVLGGRDVVQFEAGLTPRPGAINITVEGSIITEQGLIQTVKDGIDILNEDIFNASRFGEFAGVNIND